MYFLLSLCIAPLSFLSAVNLENHSPTELDSAVARIKAAEEKAKSDDEKMKAQLDALNQQLSRFRDATLLQEQKTQKEQAKIHESIQKIKNFAKQRTSSSFAQTSKLLSQSMKEFSRRTKEDAQKFGEELRKEVGYRPLLEKVEGMIPSGSAEEDLRKPSFLEVNAQTEQKAPTISVDVKAIRAKLDEAFKKGFNKSLRRESSSLPSLRKGKPSSLDLQPEQFPLHAFGSGQDFTGLPSSSWLPSSFVQDDEEVDAQAALEQAAEQINMAHAESVARGQNLGLDSDGNIVAPVSQGVEVDVTAGEGGLNFSGASSFLESENDNSNGSLVKKDLDEAASKLKEVEEDLEAHEPSIVFPPLEKRIRGYMEQAEEAVKGIHFMAKIPEKQ